MPPDVPAHLLLDPLAHHLGATLRRGNRLLSAAAQLRLRLAVNAGFVHPDPYGVSGHAVNHLFRLLEAPALKEAIDLCGADLGMIVSDRLFRDVTGNDGYVDHDRYRRVRATCKETDASAWLWLSRTGAPAAGPAG